MELPDNGNRSSNGIDEIDLLFKKIQRFDFYINSTNVKASVIIAWNGFVVGSVLLKQRELLGYFLCSPWTYHFASILLMAIGVSSIVSIGYAASVLHPFLWSSSEKRKGETGNSLFFFHDIAQLPLHEYIKREKASNYEDVIADLMTQTHVLAIGLSGKMMRMQLSVRGIICAVVCILLILLLKGSIILFYHNGAYLCNFYSLSL